ncbi:NAD-dependent epimerase/dehydratase family protein [Exiguobacterium sp. s80]|uniref:NAD-dependent epimerase/dehydratase family protein n=1 Tax=Exiguobacterium sp. s80 TaxID=2751209 RepID=UPI001BE4EFA1|nr:NAD-dependent epimerase/dehydratase family protein [Exiguobacterium sp. s80]
MKRVLVTGKSGYIGTKFKEWVEANNKEIKLDYISIRDDSWKEKDFSEYDTVLHLAGIAHVSRNPKLKELYYNINRDLTNDLAKKSKNDGVNQFIFMSSIIVYGKNSIGLVNGVIDSNTIPVPNDFYGDSKLQAEKLLNDLEDENFKIAIVRLPMVYGSKSKGNFQKIKKLSRYLPVFWGYPNYRSMIYVENLSNFIYLLIKNTEEGLYYPQNSEYVNTSKMFVEIRKKEKKSTLEIKLFNPFISLMIPKVPIVNKIFGTLIYDKKMSLYSEDYNKYNFEKSIIGS